MSLGFVEATFIGTVLEGVFYGLYCILFVLYIRVHISRQCIDRNILVYPISTLFVLSTVFFILDFTQEYFSVTQSPTSHPLLVWNLNIATSLMYSLIDFIAQGVLIYRCWVMWNQKLAVVAVPSIFALISLAISLTLVGELSLLGPQNTENRPIWFTPLGTLSFSLSLAVNAIFTGLLVFKITEACLALQRSRARAIVDFKPIISMLVESGLVFFMAQLVWVICFSLESSSFNLTSGPITMIYGIIPTTIVVRVAMRGTLDSRTSSVESTMEFSTKRISVWRNSRSTGAESKETV